MTILIPIVIELIIIAASNCAVQDMNVALTKKNQMRHFQNVHDQKAIEIHILHMHSAHTIES